MNKILKSFATGLIVVVMTCASVWAQATAEISGTVRDQTGAVLPGVEVTATQTSTGIARMTVTNETGSYVLPNLATGPYRLEASLPGFRTFVQTGIVLQVNTSPVVNPTLEVGQVTEQVEVEANAALVETRASGVGQVIENQRILELPLNGRQVTDLITLNGAAVQTTSVSGRLFSGVFIAIGGGVPFGTDYSLDGANHINFLTGVSMPTPFPDATQEFKVETSGLGANRGNSSSVGVVTKSGTNEFHGDLFEFVRNDLFNARSYFATTNSSLKRNQFGGTIGGPVIKNKLFFFGGYQGTIQRADAADTQAFVPTAAMLAGDWTAFAAPACNRGTQVTLRAPYTNNRIDPAQYSRTAVFAVNKILASLPVQPNACGLITYGGVPSQRDEHMFVTKLDWQKSDRHSLFGRFMSQTIDTPNGLAVTKNLLASGTTGTDALSTSYAFGDTFLIGNNTVQTFRLAVNRITNKQIGNSFFSWCDAGINQAFYYCGYTPTWVNAVTITGGFNFGSNFGDGLSNLTYWVPTSYQANDDISIVKGNHQLSVGVGAMYGRIIEQARFADGGQMTFNGTFTGNGLADFMTGRMQRLFQGKPNKHEASQYSINSYLADTWKVSPRFTANLGVRWEPYLPQRTPYAYEFNHDRWLKGIKSTQFVNAPPGFLYPGDPGFDKNTIVKDKWWQFMPRAGFAWDVEGNGRTSIRSSFSFGYAFLSGIWLEDSSGSNPWGGRTTLTNPPGGLDAPWQGIPGGNPFPYFTDRNAPFAPRGLFLTANPDLRTPNTYSWNMSLQRQISSDWLISASYLATRTLHIWTQNAINPAVYFPQATCTINGVTYTPCSATTNTDQRRILSLENVVEGNKIGPMAEFDDGGVQESHGMLLSIQRRAVRGITITGNYTLSHCVGVLSDINSAGPPADETGTKPGDRDFDRGNCVSDRRHIFNSTVVATTPQFANRTARVLGTGWTISGIYRWSSGQPLNIESGVDRSLTGVLRQRPSQILENPYLDRSGRPLTQWLNPAAFAQPALGGYGNVGYNSVVGPAQWSFDMALSRGFSFRETQKIEVRAEAFNVTNSFRPGSPTGGAPLATVLSTTATFGQIRTALDPRILQFALKYVF
jgi:hypothetical protein